MKIWQIAAVGGVALLVYTAHRKRIGMREALAGVLDTIGIG